MFKSLFDRYRGKKIFMNMFRAVFILPAICIFFACIGGFYWFKSNRIASEKQNDSSMLYASSLIVNNMIDRMSNTMKVLRNDNYIQKALAKDTFSWDSDMNIAAREVLNMVTVEPLFQSIYVLKGSDYLIKCSNPAYPLGKSADQMMIETFHQSRFGAYGAEYYIDIYGKSQTLLYLTDGELNPHTGEKNSGILISMDIGKAMDEIFPSLLGGEQYLLADAQGTVIYACGEGYAKGEQLTIPSFLADPESGRLRQAEVLQLSGHRFLVSCVNMENGFYLMHFLPYKYVAVSINQMRFTFIGIVLLLVLLLLLFAFGMSNWVYYPIDAVIRTTDPANAAGQTLESISGRIGNTELSSIVQTFRTMFQTVSDMNLLREQKELTHYLSSTSLQSKLPEWVEETYGKPGIHSRAVCLRISDMKDLHENHTEDAITFALQTITSVTEQVMKPLGDVLVHPVDEEYTAVLLFMEEPVLPELLCTKIREIFSVTRELVYIGLDAGISSEKTGFGDLAAMYRMARAATAYRYMYGIDAIITEEEMAQRALHGTGSADTKNLLLRLKEGDREQFREEYLVIIKELKQCSIQSARETLLNMSGEMLRYYNSLNCYFDTLSLSDYEKLRAQLDAYDYLDDTWEWFSRMLDKVCSALDKARQGEREDVVDQALQYLRTNYANPNISAQFIAEQFHITPSYFSRLFNERSGYAFPDYLATLRIEEAGKILLREQNKSIQEICEMVGYSNASYFTATFKKKYGITPGQFRKKSARSTMFLQE
ncbi:MAG: AraC family transcriptional regulator [Lachnospiraceae bacterium]|nr:AraC family transcriptional regulator [Lachnospiraceae bacterium]